ncbi:MAG: diaminopimelate epimerase [Actinomycetota bacterium]
MRFTKMEGLGNDFVVVDATVSVTPDLVRKVCDRHFGVGADGVLQVGADGAVVVMGYWNADGGSAEMCGNGLRCVARYALEKKLTDQEEFSVLTPVGLRRVQAGPSPRVEIGPYVNGTTIDFEGLTFRRVTVGNPHAVTLVSDQAVAPVAEIGRRLELATPGGINVGFAHVVNRRVIELRVWERGVGETMACGSGMVAAAAVAHQVGLTSERVKVRVPGGTGEVELSGETSWLTGPARVVFSGEL